jgi:RNA polymerase sporulation-specific sigma factor
MTTEVTNADLNTKYSENNKLLVLAKSNDESISKKAIEKLVELNSGLVKNIATHFLNRGIEYEDLVQIGMLGLMRAIEGFDPIKGFAFSTYATPVISGEIKRQIRDTGYIKVSRIYKKNAVSLLRERSRIIESEGREPGIAELAENCGLEIAEASVALDSAMPVISLNSNKYDNSDITAIDLIENEQESKELNSMIDSLALSQEISKLPPLWRKIVVLRYYRGKTQCECGTLLGLTQVKISREEKKILNYLRTKL